MENSYLLGIDIGTFGSKGVIVSPEGEVKAEDFVEHGLSLPRPGWAEHDAEKIWWKDFKLLVRRLSEKAALPPQKITSIGVSALGPDLLLVDEKGSCLRPAILYGIDTRAKEQIKKMSHIFGGEYILNLTGNSLTTQCLLPKILWLQEKEPEVFKKASKILTASSFIVFKLTGAFCIDYLNASVAGLVNIKDFGWAIEILDELHLPLDLFPRLGWATEIAGKVTSNASQETGLKKGTPVVFGTCDVGAEAISAGVIEPGETILVYGSTISFLQCLKKVISHPDLFSGFYCIPNRFFIGGATATAGALTRWFRDNFASLEKLVEERVGINAYHLLSDEISELELNPSGLLVLPFFAGARTPVNDEEARGIIAGLALSHKKAHLYKALLEGVGYEIRHNIETMVETGASPKKIMAVGGGTKNIVWMQIVSDIIGREQHCVTPALGAPLGAAFLAGLGTGIISDISYLKHKWIKIGRKIKPSSHSTLIYQKYYRLYRSFYEKTKELIHQLGRLTTY